MPLRPWSSLRIIVDPLQDEERMRSSLSAFEVVGLREGRGANALKVQLHLKVNDVVGLRDKERMRSRSTCI
jgi:hypothetical protein